VWSLSGKITINTNICKGCRICEGVCPAKIINFDNTKTNEKGYYTAQVTDMDKCIGCATCACVCPDIAIAVEKF